MTQVTLTELKKTAKSRGYEIKPNSAILNGKKVYGLWEITENSRIFKGYFIKQGLLNRFFGTNY
jgi:hypothetical protein